jgi:hypothetical protein
MPAGYPHRYFHAVNRTLHEVFFSVRDVTHDEVKRVGWDLETHRVSFGRGIPHGVRNLLVWFNDDDSCYIDHGMWVPWPMSRLSSSSDAVHRDEVQYRDMSTPFRDIDIAACRDHPVWLPNGAHKGANVQTCKPA